MRNYIFIFLLLFLVIIDKEGKSQITSIINVDSNLYYQGCIKPNILTAHPLGLFISRINHNLNSSTPTTIKLNIDIGSANVWLPEVKVYKPNDPAVAKHISAFNWDKRDSILQAFPRNFDSAVFNADGVIKTFNINVRLPLSKNFELAVYMRSFILTQGDMPFTFFSSDEMIEFFHSNIAGGEDPFARKIYGLNKAGINYQDFNGNKINISNGQFIIPGVQFNLYHYLKNDFLFKREISINTGIHLGINTSSYNQSIDIGVLGTIEKHIKLNNKHMLTLALAGSALKQKIAVVKTKTNFSSTDYFLAYETMFEYRKQLKNNFFWQIGLNFQYQSAYNQEEEFNQLAPIGNRISPHWHMAFTHLYRNNQNWTLISSFGKRWIWSFYLNEDFKVNNAPDIQTGVTVEIPIESMREK